MSWADAAQLLPDVGEANFIALARLSLAACHSSARRNAGGVEVGAGVDVGAWGRRCPVEIGAGVGVGVDAGVDRSHTPVRTATTSASPSGRSWSAAMRIDSAADVNFMEEP
jgi:hypothetical protein